MLQVLDTYRLSMRRLLKFVGSNLTPAKVFYGVHCYLC